jgi:selenide, water dikinase
MIEKNVVLLGAGNAHISFVRMFGMEPIPGVAVTLVCDTPVVLYSAMVPGHVGGEYSRDDVTIDLVRLCSAHGVRLVAQAATKLDVKARRVEFDGRPPLGWDAVSLGLGSFPDLPAGLADGPASWVFRPLGRTVDRIDELERRLKSSPKPFHMVVAGGGASGCELALAIKKRFSAAKDFRITLLQRNDRLVPTFPKKASRIFDRVLADRGVAVRLNAAITGGDGLSLVLNGSERLEYDTVLWVTNAAPPPLVRESGLKLSPSGFLEVKDTLQSTGHASVFGTGDCITLASRPDLLKNGVYAVREGGVLFRNVRNFLQEKPLEDFAPQKWCRNILNTCDGEGVYTYGALVWKTKGARSLKDRIDQEWMAMFSKFEAMKGPDGEPAPQMRCGGCGSKVAGDVLSAVLKDLDVGEDPRVLMGARAGEDAAVTSARPELFGKDPAKLVELQTVDFFKAFIDDPYLFGRIAAVHAVSDIHAMNARPFTALAMATLPYARGPVQERMLRELLGGAVRALREMGVTLTGGHTTEGAEMALGFSVTGHGEQDALFRKGALRPGDALVLTKPLGTGALLAAWMRGECRAAWMGPLTASMLLPNAAASAVFARNGVRACTDVTGFGLGGHLLEMLDGSKAAARLSVSEVPVFPGFAEVSGRGILSTLHGDNARHAGRVTGSSPPAWLFDPQTAGGLLAGVDAAKAEAVVRELREAGCERAAVIGEVLAGTPGIEIR